jgi:hypothetical protein
VWPFAFERGDMLSESEDFNRSVVPTAEEDSRSSQESTDEFDHDHMVVACRKAASAAQRQA